MAKCRWRFLKMQNMENRGKSADSTADFLTVFNGHLSIFDVHLVFDHKVGIKQREKPFWSIKENLVSLVLWFGKNDWVDKRSRKPFLVTRLEHKELNHNCGEKMHFFHLLRLFLRQGSRKKNNCLTFHDKAHFAIFHSCTLWET